MLKKLLVFCFISMRCIPLQAENLDLRYPSDGLELEGNQEVDDKSAITQANYHNNFWLLAGGIVAGGVLISTYNSNYFDHEEKFEQHAKEQKDRILELTNTKKPDDKKIGKSSYLSPYANMQFQLSEKELHIPAAFYISSDEKLEKLIYHKTVHIDQNGQLATVSNKKIVQKNPVAASPEHGDIRFGLPASVKQLIGYDDGSNNPVSMIFQAPLKSTFMKPNVDTMLICHGLKKFLIDENRKFDRGIDIGTGSGFIAKYIATRSNHVSNVTAIDIDPKAGEFMGSSGADMPNNVKIVIGDAITYLNNHLDYDLIVSNPPYVPTVEETKSNKKVAIDNPSFWQGTGLMSYLISDALPRMQQGARLVMVVPSTSLKSQSLYDVMQNLKKYGVEARLLHEQEVAYKAWFAGDNKTAHLMADKEDKPHKFGTLELHVGLTAAGHPRMQDPEINDGREDHSGYYWQVIYIIDFAKL